MMWEHYLTELNKAELRISLTNRNPLRWLKTRYEFVLRYFVDPSVYDGKTASKLKSLEMC